MAYLRQLKLTYDRKRVKDDLLEKVVKTPAKAFQLFQEMQNEVREKLICLHLNPQLKVLSYEVVAMGTAHETLCDPVEVFRGAIVVRATSIVLLHNHPSGDASPSPEDKKLTKQLFEQGKWLGIPVQDMVIIGKNEYYSFHLKKKIQAKKSSKTSAKTTKRKR